MVTPCTEGNYYCIIQLIRFVASGTAAYDAVPLATKHINKYAATIPVILARH